MFYLTYSINDELEVRDSNDELIATYGPDNKDRAQEVVRTLNSEYEALRAYFVQ